jgi:hypothetical protein
MWQAWQRFHDQIERDAVINAFLAPQYEAEFVEQARQFREQASPRTIGDFPALLEAWQKISQSQSAKALACWRKSN